MVGAFINEDPTGDEGAKWMEEPLDGNIVKVKDSDCVTLTHIFLLIP